MPDTEGVVRPLFSDIAVLEAQETRKEIPCTVDPVKPVLGFDMKFHSGYDVTVPLKSLEGNGNLLTMVFRVVPSSGPDDPIYLTQRFPVPEIEADAKGDAYLGGSFSVGDGKYHVSWLMRDHAERICSSNWDIDATLPARDKPLMPMEIAPGAVQPADRQLFKPEPPPGRDESAPPLRLKILVNFAPPSSSLAAMEPADKEGLVGILRNIARDSHVREFTLVAFNIQDEKVVFRQGPSGQMDFPALGQALQPIVFGSVKLHQLVEKHSGTEFLGDLLTHEIGDTQQKIDGVIIAGPKVMNDDSVPLDTLKQLGDLKVPVFYLNYVPNPTPGWWWRETEASPDASRGSVPQSYQAGPWRDAIGGAVRFLKGAEYAISRPRDFYVAWTEILGRIMKSKAGRTADGGASWQ